MPHLVYSFCFFYKHLFKACIYGASLVAQLIKNPPTMWETWVQSLDWEPLEEGMATHLVATHCLENPHGQRSLAGYSPWGHRVGHDWATQQQQQCNCIHFVVQQISRTFSSCRTETWYTCNSTSLFPIPPPTGNHHSTLFLYFDYFSCLTWVELYSTCQVYFT